MRNNTTKGGIQFLGFQVLGQVQVLDIQVIGPKKFHNTTKLTIIENFQVVDVAPIVPPPLLPRLACQFETELYCVSLLFVGKLNRPLLCYNPVWPTFSSFADILLQASHRLKQSVLRVLAIRSPT